MLADLLVMRRSQAFTLDPVLPGAIEVGRPADALFRIQGRPPPRLDTILEVDDRLACGPARHAANAVRFRLTPRRRGTAVLAALHLRWGGPLGLLRRVERRTLDRAIPVIPAISQVREAAMRLFSRNNSTGRALQRDCGLFHRGQIADPAGRRTAARRANALRRLEYLAMGWGGRQRFGAHPSNHAALDRDRAADAGADGAGVCRGAAA